MKKSSKAMKVITGLFLIFTVMTFTSCKKEGCTDTKAENYDSDAKDDDGTCTFARTKFIGSYNVNENCTSGNYNYSITVATSTTGEEFIVINNFGGYGINVKSTVNGGNITFNDTQDGISFSGSGSISGNTLTIIYTASVAGQTDNCTATCIKQ